MPKLVLTRKIGQKIQVGDDTTITVVEVNRGYVRLAIEAPRDVSIYRTELLPVPTPPAMRTEGK